MERVAPCHFYAAGPNEKNSFASAFLNAAKISRNPPGGKSTKRYYVAECIIQGYTAMMLLLLASFMVVVPSTDVSTATGNRFLGRYQSGRDDDSPCADKEKYEHSK
jgi:hypothetical protein